MSQEERKAMKKRRNANKWIFVTSADMAQFYIAAKVRKKSFQTSVLYFAIMTRGFW